MQFNETPPSLANVTTRRRADSSRAIKFLRGEHERLRWFCAQLLTLSDDIWQPGHEKLAAALLDFATAEVPNTMDDQTELPAPALLRRCVSRIESKGVVAEMVRRHQGVAMLAAPTIDGLDRLARGGMPPVPTQFILSALGLVETLKQNLDWEETVLLPLAASSLTEADQRDLESAMARRHIGSSP